LTLNTRAQTPTISSFSPLNGAAGATVTITGTNFNTTAANNIVFFGATRATVNTASATSLTVAVPTGATHAAITVLNTGTGLAAYSQVFFLPTFTPNKGSIATSDIDAKVDFTTGSNPYSVAIGDIDGDGKPDLAIANYNSSTVSVLRNTGSSGSIGFATKVDFTTGSSPYSVAIGDIDGDGKPDLAVANYDSNTVSVLRNTGSSGSIGFATKVDFTTGSAPFSVAIGDIDGDGKPDLAVANYSSNTVSVLRNTGNSGSIGFATKVDFTTGSGPQSVAIGDIDRDGKPDLAIANTSIHTVSVLRNTGSSGSIGFATKVDFTTGSNPSSIAIGDIDGDGKPDLAVTNYNSTTVSVLRNTGSSGSIGFATKVDLTTGTLPFSVAIGDIDGDGKPDLAVANYGSTTVSVLRNTGSSGSIGFATKVDFTTGSSPYYVAIGDIDGDGKPDLAVGNFGSNTASVLRNKPVILSATGTLSAVNTTYGTASASPTSFTVSGLNMAAGITITPPTGFEVSQTAGGASGYAGSGTAIIVGSAGTIASTTIYVRLAATTAVGVYSGNVVCTSTSATTANVATVSSTVSAAALTVTATNASRTYGSTLTGGTGSTAFTSGGLQNSETIGSVTITYASGAGNGNAAGDAVGTYTGKVTPSAATGGTFTASNYSITFATGNIIVSAAALTVTASNASKTYGSTLTGGTGSTAFSSSGLLNSETIGSVTIAYASGAGNGNTAGDAVGTYTGKGTPSAATGGTFTASNYNITYATGNIIVSTASLTVTATNASKIYGSTLTGGTGSTAFTTSGLLNSETIGSVTIAYASGAGNGNTAADAVGTYTGKVTPSAATGGTFTASNYSITYATGDIIVGAAALTVTATNASKTYGSTLTSGTGSTAFTSSGLQNSETIGTVTIAYASGAGNGNTAADAAGTYTGKVTPSVATGGTFTASNYSITFAAGNIIVSTASLTVTASNASKTYGSTLTGGTGSTAFSSSSLQNSETIGSVTIAYATGVGNGNTAGDAVGTYSGKVTPSAASDGTFTASNYSITYATGDIIVGAAALTVTATNASKTYGSTLTGGTESIAFTSSGLLNSETIGTVTIAYVSGTGNGNTATDAVGTYTGKVTPSAASGGTFTASNYSITYATGNIIISAVPLTITADNKIKFAGTANPVLTVSYSGFIGTETAANLATAPTVSTTAITTSLPGTYPITVSGAVAANYSITYVPGVLTVSPGAPDNISLTPSVLYENQPSGTQAGTLSSTSPDPNATFTYSLVSGTGSTENALFSISGSNLLTAAALNYEQKVNYSILVRSTAQNGLSLDKQFTITINDVNEAPTLTAISNQVICFTVNTQTITLAGITAGPETGQTTTLTVSTDKPTMLGLLSITGNTLSYRLNTGVVGSANITITVKDNGGSANGGIDTITRIFLIQVNALPVPAITSNIGPDISKGQTAQLTASGGTSYIWANANAPGIVLATNINFSVRPAITTTYIVTVTNASGCISIQSITLNVLEDYMALSANNVLTPNGDGKNDTWVIKNIDMYPNNIVKVFDRAGRLVYSKQKYTNDWQGTLEGAPLNEDTYYYVVDFGPGLGEMRGYISIVR